MKQKQTSRFFVAAAFTGLFTGELLQANAATPANPATPAQSAATPAKPATPATPANPASPVQSAATPATPAKPATPANPASPVQSALRPGGLDIAAPVQTAASDAASAEFQTSHLPGMLNLAGSRLGESVSQKDVSALVLDPSRLTLSTDAAARVYFLAEGGGHSNTLGLDTLSASTGAGGAAAVDDNARLIFPGASSHVSLPESFASGPARTLQEPLLAGDFVDPGTMAGGPPLDFFLIASGVSDGGTGTPSTADGSPNQDKMPHTVSFAVADSPYLIIGFEAAPGGGGRDHNDLVLAANTGAQNVKNLISAPEPAALLTMGGFLGLALCRRRRSLPLTLQG